MTRQEALILLLAEPDLLCLPRRGYRYILPRDPKRDPDVIKRKLKMAYCEHRCQDHTDISCVVSVRRLKIARRSMIACCQWYLDDIGGESVWETECKHAFEFTNDGPKENGFKFCCYCGKPLAVVLHSEEKE